MKIRLMLLALCGAFLLAVPALADNPTKPPLENVPPKSSVFGDDLDTAPMSFVVPASGSGGQAQEEFQWEKDLKDQPAARSLLREGGQYDNLAMPPAQQAK